MNPVSASSPPSNTSADQPDGLATSIVSNIPVHNQGGAPAAGASNEDDELDKIMQDVNHELKKTEKMDPGHHFSFERKHHKKTEAKFSAQPVQVMDVRSAPPPASQSAAAKAHHPAPPPAAAHQAKPNPRPQAQQRPAQPAKPPKTSHAPVMAIILTLVITSGL